MNMKLMQRAWWWCDRGETCNKECGRSDCNSHLLVVDGGTESRREGVASLVGAADQAVGRLLVGELDHSGTCSSSLASLKSPKLISSPEPEAIWPALCLVVQRGVAGGCSTHNCGDCPPGGGWSQCGETLGTSVMSHHYQGVLLQASSDNGLTNIYMDGLCVK
jgi:hypothetical protein